MHQTRKEAAIKLPLLRKGTKYIARARSYVQDSVPVVIAVRDMLKLAKISKEVKQMIHQKLLKINGKSVKELKESIKLFNKFEAGKTYILTLSNTRKFIFEEIKSSEPRLCKILNKRLVSGGKTQLNLHDGTNILSEDKVSVGDSLYLDDKNAIKKYIPLKKGSDVMVISGKYLGAKGKVEAITENKISINFKGGQAELRKSQLIAL